MDDNEKRPRFGNRFLKNEKDVFTHNAWDNVQWNDEQESCAKRTVFENSEVKLSSSDILKLEETASEKWNAFYSIHQNRFFKDRHWLFTEFSELSPKCSEIGANEDDVSVSETTMYSNEKNQEQSMQLKVTSDSDNSTSLFQTGEKYHGENSTRRILEVGCGVGNTVFPILETNKDPNLFIYCCDFSETAVNIVKQSEDYDADRCQAFVYDITSDNFDTPFPEASLDVVICIFVLSALQPDKIDDAVKRLVRFLKPGGIFLFRDYGRYDMAQLRFKKGRCIGDNFYARGDGTRCYFFTQDDVRRIMEAAGLKELQHHVDRRLQVNRGKQLTMYRVWIQARYQKPYQS